jgi:hypothetical protein
MKFHPTQLMVLEGKLRWGNLIRQGPWPPMRTKDSAFGFPLQKETGLTTRKGLDLGSWNEHYGETRSLVDLLDFEIVDEDMRGVGRLATKGCEAFCLHIISRDIGDGS